MPDNLADKSKSDKADQKGAGEPVFPAGIDDPLVYEAYAPQTPSQTNERPSLYRAAAEVAEDALKGAASAIENEAVNHTRRFVLEVGMGALAISAGPLTAGGVLLVGGIEAAAAAEVAGTVAGGLGSTFLGIGAIAGGEAAYKNLKAGLKKSQPDIDIVMNPAGKSSEQIAAAHQRIEKNLGQGTLEAILTVAAGGTAAIRGVSLLRRLRAGGKATIEVGSSGAVATATGADTTGGITIAAAVTESTAPTAAPIADTAQRVLPGGVSVEKPADRSSTAGGEVPVSHITLVRIDGSVIPIPEGATSVREAVEMLVENKVDLRDADLNGANLRDADLNGANLRGANLRDADLNGANLRDAYLRGARLNGANLRDAYLRGARLDGARLIGADLRGARLDGARLIGADLFDADLFDADLRDAYLRGARLDGARLIGADLRGADLRDADLRDAYLRGARLDGARLIGADLRGADLRDAYLRGADLFDADLRGADLRGADLRDALLDYAKLREAFRTSPLLPEAVSNLVKDAPPYKQAAAEIAWRQVVPDAPQNIEPSEVQLQKFSQLWSELSSKGSAYIRTATDDPSLQLMTFQSSGFTGNHAYLSWHSAIMSNKSETDDISQIDTLFHKFNPGTFKNALEHIDPKARNLQNSDVPNLSYFHNTADLAFRLERTFTGKHWKEWLSKQDSIGRNNHDASYWLPVATYDKLKGLSSFLFQHYNRPVGDLQTIAGAWPDLTEQRRVLPYDELLKDIRRSLYPAVRHEQFASFAARFGLPKNKYVRYESNFIASLDVLSSFPLDKSWNSNKLTGAFNPRNDPSSAFIGKLTDCCLSIDDIGNAAALHAVSSPNGGAFMVKNQAGDVIAGSWITVNRNEKGEPVEVLFNNIESRDFRPVEADNKTRIGKFNIGPYQQDTARIYQAAADHLALQFPTINTIAVGHKVTEDLDSTDIDLSIWKPAAPEDAVALPPDYEGRSEAHGAGAQQFLLFKRTQPN